jgi:hypothetical protein
MTPSDPSDIDPPAAGGVTIGVVVRHPEHARPNEPVVYPVRKVNEGRRVDLPPPLLESHPPGGRLEYRRQEQPIAARAARRRTTENAIVIVVAITRGQAKARVLSQEVVEPKCLRPSSSSSSRWKSIDGSKTRFAHRKPSSQISIDRNDRVRLALAKTTVYDRPYALSTSSKNDAIDSAGRYIGRASEMCDRPRRRRPRKG